VFESPDDAKEAINQLNGFHLMERYIVGECARVRSEGYGEGEGGIINAVRGDPELGRCGSQRCSHSAPWSVVTAHVPPCNAGVWTTEQEPAQKLREACCQPFRTGWLQQPAWLPPWLPL
jgi:hypothetical protein